MYPCHGPVLHTCRISTLRIIQGRPNLQIYDVRPKTCLQRDLFIKRDGIHFKSLKDGQTLQERGTVASLSGPRENMHFACGLMGLGFVWLSDCSLEGLQKGSGGRSFIVTWMNSVFCQRHRVRGLSLF